MSFFVFALIFGFILWRQLGKSRRPEKAVQPGASPRAAITDDDKVEDIATDVAGLVSSFLGQNSKDLIEQVVSRAIQDSRIGTGRAEAIEPIVRAVSSARPSAREKQRTKYLLDSDGGYRQRTDRTARLQQQFSGKGLCSPLNSGPAKARQKKR
ncbi:hypothetical protein [Mesorhizobium sp. NZP2077]|uniref:hypothetical protein n=1 Tax=Mesorhizobium sp. NZP2077 TaxID=2483404 RepID=UPI001554A4CC|nr:hypothetical protein [Mesorhizobium sp. NZP2077]QKC82571.1 hypothetical protein EB232_13950 [Mesorhizobium sp. NZP2077]QKD16066.1 hypothetical protein HGP13_13750 [Mesorhizobium sp. NZP2077]